MIHTREMLCVSFSCTQIPHPTHERRCANLVRLSSRGPGAEVQVEVS